MGGSKFTALLRCNDWQDDGIGAARALCALAIIGAVLGVLAPAACATREIASMGWTFKASGRHRSHRLANDGQTGPSVPAELLEHLRAMVQL
jgi:hypothetical protein